MIHIRAHELFVREGPHLIAELPITFPQAALGDTIEVPVLKGKAELTVPPGTQPGQRLVLKGKGMPHLRGRGKGDLHYEVVVEVPTSPVGRARKRCSRSSGECPRMRPGPGCRSSSSG